MKLDADCDRTMQYYVGMMQHGDGMVPRQSNEAGGYPHPAATNVLLFATASPNGAESSITPD